MGIMLCNEKEDGRIFDIHQLDSRIVLGLRGRFRLPIAQACQIILSKSLTLKSTDLAFQGTIYSIRKPYSVIDLPAIPTTRPNYTTQIRNQVTSINKEDSS